MISVKSSDCCIRCTDMNKYEKLNCDSGCHKAK